MVAENPPCPKFSFENWWPVGGIFLMFMSNAIWSAWQRCCPGDYDFGGKLAHHIETYLDIVYGQPFDGHLITDFITQRNLYDIRSGEFDALSYGLFLSAYEVIDSRFSPEEAKTKRHEFTQHVGKVFYEAMAFRLHLVLPKELDDNVDVEMLKNAIDQIGMFLLREGYLFDRFAFSLDVDTKYKSKPTVQSSKGFLTNLKSGGTGYALYEMGYPIILPSAIYLSRSRFKEAQHHSSRIIEEVFDRIGYEAHETPDFDPTEHNPGCVVEFWKISKK